MISEHHAKYKNIKKRWNQANADRTRLYAFRGVLKKHNMSMEDYERILVEQGGVCAICRQDCKVRTRLVIDHSHSTGKVRGLLCNGRNVAIGHLKEDPQIFQRAVEYLTLSKVIEAANDSSFNPPTSGARAA